MIDVNPNKSFAHNFAVGQGEAQVQDLGIAQNALHQKAQLAQEDKKAKEAARQKQQQDLLALAATNTSGIKPADQPYFLGETEKLHKMTYDAINPKTGSISIPDQLKIRQQANKIKMEAELSKNQRERLEAETNKFDPTKHDAADLAKLHEAYKTPQNWDSFQPLQENIDLTKDTRENLLPIVEKHINTGQRGTVEFSDPQATAMLSTRYESNPLIKAQAIKDYVKMNPTGEVTPENVKNNYIATQKPHLLQSKVTYAPQAAASFNLKESLAKPNLTGDFTTTPTETGKHSIFVNNKDGDERKRMDFETTVDNNGKQVITKAIITPTLTDAEQKENAEIIANNKAKAAALKDEKEIYNYLMDKVTSDTAKDEDIAQFNAMTKKYGGRPSERNADFKPAKVKGQPEVITDQKEIVKRAYGEFQGADLQDYLKNQTTKTANVLGVQETPKAKQVEIPADEKRMQAIADLRAKQGGKISQNQIDFINSKYK